MHLDFLINPSYAYQLVLVLIYVCRLEGISESMWQDLLLIFIYLDLPYIYHDRLILTYATILLNYLRDIVRVHFILP